MNDIDPWVAGRMGGTGRSDQQTYKVRDIRPPGEDPRRSRRRRSRRNNGTAGRRWGRVRQAPGRRRLSVAGVLMGVIVVASIASVVVLLAARVGLWSA